jgi:hypothetical protein
MGKAILACSLFVRQRPSLADLAEPFGQERGTGEKAERAVGGASAAAGLPELASMGLSTALEQLARADRGPKFLVTRFASR